MKLVVKKNRISWNWYETYGEAGTWYWWLTLGKQEFHRLNIPTWQMAMKEGLQALKTLQGADNANSPRTTA